MKKRKLLCHFLLLWMLSVPFIHTASHTAIPSSRKKTVRVDTTAGIRFLQEFYHAYIAHKLTPYNREDSIASKRYIQLRESLKRKALTKEFYLKLDRIETTTEACGICHTQEYSKEWLKTLQVRYLEGNWYKVTFWEKGRDECYTNERAVRLTTCHDSLRIDYITPLWYGSGYACKPFYGDSLFYERPLRVKIDHSSPEAFLRTFYKAYTMGYTSLQVDLEAYIGNLRKKYLLPAAMEDMREREELLESDGRSGYDLLIEGFIFDRLWEKHLKFIPQAEELSYKLLCHWTAGDTQMPYLILKLVRQGSEYRIGRIIFGYDERKKEQRIDLCDKNGNFIPSQTQKGIDAINFELNRGKPVIVGVDYHPGSPNTDGVTDHFVVIVGRNENSSSISYHYYDPQTSNVAHGTSNSNQLYLTADNTLEGTYTPLRGKDRQYKVTTIRLNR